MSMQTPLYLPNHKSIDGSFRRDQLHVITPLTNPERFESRYALYDQYAREIRDHGAHLVTVEAAFGDRRYHVTEPSNPDHIQLRTPFSYQEIWLKENLINLGVARLSQDWEYVAWVDADVHFVNPNWAEETIHQLQHFDIVQMFQTAVDTGPKGEVFNTYNGFGYSFAENLPEFMLANASYYQKAKAGAKYWHPGFAWAARREAFEALGGLIDFAILGAADHHMALALIGQAKRSLPQGIHKNYARLVHQWEERASIHIRQNIGYVPGTLVHRWHGKKQERRYWDRWSIIRKHDFDPDADLKRDYQGVWQLTHAGIRMRNDVRSYFRSRNEDSVDI